MNTELKISDTVIVPDPNETDIHNHSFTGHIKEFNHDQTTAFVEDGDGDVFEIEVERLQPYKDPIIKNIMRVADIDCDDISHELLKKLEGNISYTDNVLGEHLYDPDTILEELNSDDYGGDEWPQLLIDELETLRELCDTHQCTYIRVTFG